MADTEYLDQEDRAIVEDCLRPFGDMDWCRFWSHEEIQLDGNFTLEEMRALVSAMERMQKRPLTTKGTHDDV